MNSDDYDVPTDRTEVLDNLLGAFASRANPDNSFGEINFKKIPDLAETIYGEKPFEERAKKNRTESRRIYNKYRSGAARGTYLEVDTTWDVFTILIKIAKLVYLLNTPGSSSLSPPPTAYTQANKSLIENIQERRSFHIPAEESLEKRIQEEHHIHTPNYEWNKTKK